MCIGGGGTITRTLKRFLVSERESDGNEEEAICGSGDWLAPVARGNGRGRLRDEDLVKLKNARCAVYFSSPTKGLFGLAAIGPQKESRVSPPVASVTLRQEVILDCTPEAVKAWDEEPWE